MRTKKNIIGIITIFSLFISGSCTNKAPVQPPKFNKAAARDVIAGNTWYMKGCYHKALESFHKAYEKFTACDDQEGIARTLNNLGSLYRAEKDYDSALLFFDEARRIFSSIGESRGLVQTLSNKAAVYTDMNDLAKAEAALDEADAIALNKTIVLPTLKSNRALVCIRQKKTDQAKTLLTEALSMTSEDKPFEYSTITHAMGVLMETSGEPDQALVYYNKALEADRKASYSRNTATDLSDIGRVLIAQGKHEEALDVLYRSFNIQTLLDDPIGAEATSVQIKLCLETLGDKKPDIRVKEHFLKRWSEGEKKAGLCK
ncbi:MAG: tetratricopeptide repeat protein [Desulfobacteraceae bacterium]|jgi:tetratricopeptide (TPR) repeat protein